MAKQNGNSPELAAILEADAHVAELDKQAAEARKAMGVLVESYLKKNGKQITRKLEDGTTYNTYASKGVIPVADGSAFIELRLRRLQDGTFSGLVVRKAIATQ